MPNCSFCGSKEHQDMPLCQSCGALRYPITNSSKQTASKLKYSVAIAATLFTPGSFVVLALVGANKLNTKLKKTKH